MSNTTNDPKIIFAENLARARKRLGKSQDELAKAVGLTRQAIFKYEKGEVNPSMDAIYRLSTVLNVPIDYFFQKASEQEEFGKWLEIIDISPLTNIQYREKQNLDEETDLLVKTETYKELIKLLAVETLTDSRITFKNPIDKLSISSREDAEKAALEVRKKWQLYDNPIANVINLLETKGVRVIEIDASESFQGLSAKYGELPIIVLNFSVPEVTRKRFTALHELGHLILQIPDGLSYKAIEEICNAFAAMMLMPRQLLVLELGEKRKTLSKDELLRIKSMYGISVLAIIVGAAIAKIITWAEYEKLKKDMDSVGYDKKYFILEKATRFEQLLNVARTENQIDDRTANLLIAGSVPKSMSKKQLITSALC